MSYLSAKQLCFPPIAGQTIRADFEGGALSSDFGALLLRGIDRQIGLTERFAAAIHDKRHQSYIDHPLRDLLAQRIYQIASGYADGNDANSLRRDPLFKLSMERSPLDPEHDLASAPTFSRLEHSVDRKDLYRLTQALVDHFIASDPEPPAAIVLDVDHSDDPTHGQQEFTFYNHYYKNYCYLPLFIFEGTSHALVMAYLRPGTRPTGAENAMILSRLLSYLRRYWPQTHILVRGDSHFATPEVIEVIAHRRLTDFVFGLAGNAVLLRQAAPLMQEARQLPAAPPGLCRVCAPPCLAYAHAATHGARHRPTLDPHCDALQSGNAGQAVQRPDPPPPAHVLPRQRAPATGHCLALSRPSTRLEHVLRPHAAAALTGSFSSHGTQDSTPRRSLREADGIFCRAVPLGAWCAQSQESGGPASPRN